MRIVVLGSEGMLGHKMVEILREWFKDVVGLSRKDGLDATDMNTVKALLTRWKPHVVVNCIGLIKQREIAWEHALSVNSLFPQNLQVVCSGLGARLVHFSTDCVFSGAKGSYTEQDVPDPQDIYGISKRLGEVQYLFSLTIRTSIIGRERTNYKGLLEWFLHQKGTIQGHQHAVWSGVTTNYLSGLVASVLYELPSLHGLYHVASPPVSKLHLLRMFKSVYGKNDVTIVPASAPVCDRSLNGEKFECVTRNVIPTLSEQIQMMYEQDERSGYASF